MARKPTRGGHRAAPQSGSYPEASTNFTLTGGKSPELFLADSYDVAVVGARAIPYRKSGSTVVELTLESLEDGRIVDLDTMLVNSPGGNSSLVARNRGMLTDLADIAEGQEVGFRELMDKLNTGTIKAEISVYVGTAMDGRPVNKLGSVDALITDEKER
jgi:hypothetical protein